MEHLHDVLRSASSPRFLPLLNSQGQGAKTLGILTSLVVVFSTSDRLRSLSQKLGLLDMVVVHLLGIHQADADQQR